VIFVENIIRGNTLQLNPDFLIHRLNPGQIISLGGKVKDKPFGFVHSIPEMTYTLDKIPPRLNFGKPKFNGRAGPVRQPTDANKNP